MPKPSVCRAANPVWKNKKAFIDVHCHTFNISDLPYRQFLRKVFLNSDESVIRKLVEPLLSLLDDFADKAPGKQEEMDKIRRLLWKQKNASPELFAKSLAAGLDQPQAGVISRQEMQKVLHKKLLSMMDSKDADVQGALDELRRGLLASLPLPPLSKDLLGISAGAMAEALMNAKGPIGRYLDWINLFMGFRVDIVQRLINMYGQDNGCVELFIPALVDYDLWLGDRPATSLPDQMDLMEQIMVLHEGRLHFFYPYDPWREAVAKKSPEGSMHWVKEAVEERGFIGVKFYNPMGYRACQNEGLDFSKVTDQDPKQLGKKLDKALHKLYQWCAKNDVPIMTHCNDTNYVKECYGRRASPEYWAEVARKYEGIRINLGHFGGMEHKRPDNECEKKGGYKSWLDTIGQAMIDGNLGVYADLSCYPRVLRSSSRKKLFDRLDAFFAKYPNARDRIMYGSDWIMLGKAKNCEAYFQEFSQEYYKRFGAQEALKFLGSNAASFLGLLPGDKTRERLAAFYEKHGMDQPEWFARLGE